MDNEQYRKGQEMGELRADIKNIQSLLERHIEKQDEWNLAIDARLKIAETWIQTTTGKVVILTSIFGIVGSISYFIVNWFINHKFK